MIKFFRRIRQNLLSEGKTGKYFKYAIGEIVLVVIGILLALSINNWNSNRIKKNNTSNYYNRIIIELNQEIISAKQKQQVNTKLISYNRRALSILNSKNLDSLEVLKDLLGATATNFITEYSFPVTDEFLNQNYLSTIKNDSLKIDFQLFTALLKSIEGMNNYNDNQYQNTIEPFFIKNINYSSIALTHFRKNLVSGGPKTDFGLLFENLELWNIVTFKLESLETESKAFEGSIDVFESLKSKLETELKDK